MNLFNNKITRITQHLMLTLLLVSCGGGGGSQPSGVTSPPLTTIATGTVNTSGGTVTDPLGETVVIVQPGAISGDATITIKRGRDASGNLVTTFSSSTPTATPVDIILPPEDVVESNTPVSAALATGLVNASPPCDSTVYPIQYPCGQTVGKALSTNDFFCKGTDASGGVYDSSNGRIVKAGWFRRCAGFWRTGSSDSLNPSLGDIEQRMPTRTSTSAYIYPVGTKISYRPAAILSSECAFDNTACYANNKEPVLFVHGYTRVSGPFVDLIDNGFGGGVGTFGEFSNAMKNDGYVTFEFRWVTAARFEDVAADLGRAIDQIAERTGKKVHVIAHSFGGVLTRTYLQGFATDYPYKKTTSGVLTTNVATLTTIGSPHSGIFKDAGQHGWGTTFYPGQDSVAFKGSDQLSVYQMGDDNSNITKHHTTFGVGLFPGEMAYKLLASTQYLPDVPIQVLIGLTTKRFDNTVVDDGDGLITYQGQRFLPRDGSRQPWGFPSLHTAYPMGAAFITEKILGNPVFSNVQVQPGYPNSFLGDQYIGYRHNPLLTPYDSIPEVCVGCTGGILGNVPVHSGQHSAVINAKQWILAHPSIEAPIVSKFTLTGTLTDSKTGLPLKNVAVSVGKNGGFLASGVTDTSGAFSLSLDFQPSSDYLVKATKTGYVSVRNIISTASSLVPVVNANWTLNPIVGSAVPIIHTLNISNSGSGMVIGLGISCSPVCKSSFKEGDYVQLYAQAYSGSIFSGWIGCDTTVGSRCDVSMSADKTIAATFVATPVSYTFEDNFDGTALQSAYWSPIPTAAASGSTITVSGGIADFSCSSMGSHAGVVDTNGKYTFSGDPITIEAKMSGAGTSRNTSIYIVEVNNTGEIAVGDTSYGVGSGLGGLYMAGSGVFNLPQTGNDVSANGYKEYRITLSGASLTVERGDTLASITETRTVTLGSSIAGKTFYLRIGSNTAPYCPAAYDWIRVVPSVNQVTSGYFSSTGSMSTPRLGQTATLLPSGKVLIVGGDNSANAAPYLNTAELYDPVTGVFSLTGNMSIGRSGHTATLLANGTVLITGGNDAWLTNHTLMSAEVYDPTTGLFTPTGNMVGKHIWHTATLLANNKVLIAGGADLASGITTYLNSAEIYDPATGIFTPTGSMNDSRIWFSATLLNSGKVLLAGGSQQNGGTLTSTELYDPSTGVFTISANFSTPRLTHFGTTVLPNNKVLFIGGGNFVGGGAWLKSAEIYDATTGTISSGGNLNIARSGASPILLSDGSVLVAGGYDGATFLASAEIYDPNSATSSPTSGAMNSIRYNHTVTKLQNDRVLLTGGQISQGIVNSTTASAELYGANTPPPKTPSPVVGAF